MWYLFLELKLVLICILFLVLFVIFSYIFELITSHIFQLASFNAYIEFLFFQEGEKNFCCTCFETKIESFHFKIHFFENCIFTLGRAMSAKCFISYFLQKRGENVVFSNFFDDTKKGGEMYMNLIKCFIF